MFVRPWLHSISLADFHGVWRASLPRGEGVALYLQDGMVSGHLITIHRHVSISMQPARVVLDLTFFQRPFLHQIENAITEHWRTHGQIIYPTCACIFFGNFLALRSQSTQVIIRTCNKKETSKYNTNHITAQILRVPYHHFNLFNHHLSTLGFPPREMHQERLGIYSLERGHFEKVRVSDHETCLNVLASSAFLKGTGCVADGCRECGRCKEGKEGV